MKENENWKNVNGSSFLGTFLEVASRKLVLTCRPVIIISWLYLCYGKNVAKT